MPKRTVLEALPDLDGHFACGNVEGIFSVGVEEPAIIAEGPFGGAVASAMETPRSQRIFGRLVIITIGPDDIDPNRRRLARGLIDDTHLKGTRFFSFRHTGLASRPVGVGSMDVGFRSRVVGRHGAMGTAMGERVIREGQYP